MSANHLKVKTFGSDVEWFMTSPDVFPGILPAWELIPYGSREKVAPGVYIFSDNAAVEMNTPVYRSSDSFVTNTIRNFQKSLDYLKKRFPGVDLLPYPKGKIPNKYKNVEYSWIAGCDPFFNCFNRDPFFPLTVDFKSSMTRWAGGHVHMGFGDFYLSEEETLEFVSQLSTKLSKISVPQRKVSAWGRAGNFRITNYGTSSGIEYRSLCNSWILDKKKAGILSSVLASV